MTDLTKLTTDQLLAIACELNHKVIITPTCYDKRRQVVYVNDRTSGGGAVASAETIRESLAICLRDRSEATNLAPIKLTDSPTYMEAMKDA